MNLANRYAVAAFAALCALPALGQQQKTIEGVVINFGLVSAERAVHAEGHRDMHPDKFPSGSQHVLITLADGKTGRPIGDADVQVEVRDPKGSRVAKPLLHTSAGGMPDYSELFVFGWSGAYTLDVTVTPAKAAKRLKTSFIVHHSL
jgi:hypothetical protein